MFSRRILTGVIGVSGVAILGKLAIDESRLEALDLTGTLKDSYFNLINRNRANEKMECEKINKKVIDRRYDEMLKRFVEKGPTIKWNRHWDQESLISDEELESGDCKHLLDHPKSEKSKSRRRCRGTKHIFLIRHGQYNLEGLTDEEKYLTKLGRLQAEFCGKRLKEILENLKIDSFFVSTMTRANETGTIIANELFKDGINNEIVSFDDLLREGPPFPTEPPHKNWHPDLRMIEREGSRIEHAFDKYIRRRSNPSKDDEGNDEYQIIVCHANVIRYFLCRALQIPPEAWLRFSLRHASITHLRIRSNGCVSAAAIGDAGFMPPDYMTTS
ncbi:hypothetical protein SNEBB_001346 [Seison nebaliae]|nr:hypothetical protein SNEBB_001346 [Seison nebaliae]